MLFSRVPEVQILRSIQILISAGVSVQDAIQKISVRLPDRRMAARMDMAAELVRNEGKTLPDALRETGLFEQYVEVLDMGQRTGNLKEIMKETVDVKEDIDGATAKIKAAVYYPLFVVAFSILVGFGLTYVLEKVIGSLNATGVKELFAYKAGRFIIDHRFALFGGYTLALVGFVVAVVKNAHRVPVVSGIYNALNLGQAFRTLAVGLMSGLSPSQGFEMVSSMLRGKWRSVCLMIAAEMETRNVLDVVDEIEQYLPVEGYLILKTKIESADMAEGFAIVGSTLMDEAVRKLGNVGTVVNIVAMLFVAIQIVGIMSPIYAIVISFVDRISSGEGF